MIARSIVVYTIALSLLVVAVVCYRRRWSRSVALLISAAGCFIIVATVHVFEALSIFPAAGWGRPGSVGHYVDLGAAVLGTLLLSGAIVAGLGRQRVK